MRFRGSIWSHEETEVMLNIIKKNNLLAKSPSNTQLGETLEKPMQTLGFERSAQQIRFKLKALRATYILAQRRGCTPQAIEECPFYELLDELYLTETTNKNNDSDSETNANDSIATYSNVWTDEEMRKMLSIIDMMGLSKDLSLQALAPSALKIVSKGMNIAGYQKTAKQVHGVLMSLRTAYIKARVAEEKGRTCEPCPYFDLVHKLWKSQIYSSAEIAKLKEANPSFVISNTQLNRHNIALKRTPHDKILWTDDETQALMDLIVELNLTGEFKFRLSGAAIEKLVKPMAERGYDRSSSQILGKLKNMRSSYFKCVESGRTPESIKECPHFERLDNMFVKFKKLITVSKLQLADHNYGNDKSTDHSYVSTEEPTFEVKKPNSAWHSIESIKNENSTSFMNNFEDYENIDDELVQQHEIVGDDIMDYDTINAEDLLGILPEKLSTTDTTENKNLPTKKEIPTVELTPPKKQMKKQPRGKLKFVKVLQCAPKNQFVIGRKEVPSKSPPASPFATALSSDNDNLSSVTMTSPSKSSTFTIGNSQKRKTPFSPIPSTSSTVTTPSTDTTAVPESMTLLMQQYFKHEERMQKQHHTWMERQFELQRRHDREQRELLINELREFRQVIISMSQNHASS